MSEQIQIVVVEDHPPVRQGLELLLASLGFRTIGSAGSAQAGARMIRARKPDVALVDIDLGDGSGIDLARAANDDGLSTAIVLYTGSITSSDVIDDAYGSGACALVVQSSPTHHLTDAIRAAAAGRNYIDSSVTRIARRLRDQGARTTSKREAQVLTLIAGGRTTEQVADDLYLSPQTVQTHVRNAIRKLGGHGRLHTVILALQKGEIALPEGLG